MRFVDVFVGPSCDDRRMLSYLGLLLLGVLGLIIFVIVVIVIFMSITIAIDKIRHPIPAPLPDARVIEMLRTLNLGEIPEPLRGAPPRADVFSFRGYLKQKVHRRTYLPMLTEGPVYRGLCICLHKRQGAGECDVTYEYAWLDDKGRLHRHRASVSYDTDVGCAVRYGDVFLAIDANFELHKPVVIVCSTTTDKHIVYEALGIETDPLPPPENPAT